MNGWGEVDNAAPDRTIFHLRDKRQHRVAPPMETIENCDIKMTYISFTQALLCLFLLVVYYLCVGSSRGFIIHMPHSFFTFLTCLCEKSRAILPTLFPLTSALSRYVAGLRTTSAHFLHESSSDIPRCLLLVASAGPS